MTDEHRATQSGESAEAGAKPERGQVLADEQVNLLDLLILMLERKRAILWTTAVFVVLGVAAAFLLPKRYTAEVTLLPPLRDTSLSNALASPLRGLGGMAELAGGSLGLKNPNDMYVAMFRSQTVEDAMIRRFGLMREYRKRYLTDARKKFEKYAVVDGSAKDGLIHITVEDGNPARAAKLANGYVEEFRNLSRHLAMTEAGQRALFFKQQLAQTKKSLADAENALLVTEKKTGLIQLDSQAQALIASAASLKAQIAVKQMQIRGMQTYATGENAQMVQARHELDSLRAQLAQLGGSRDLGDEGILVPKGQVPKATLEYARKLRDVKYYDTIFNILARQYELAKLDEAREGALIQVVDPAIPPDKKSSPKRLLIIICATLLGLLAGICRVWWQASLERMREEPEGALKLRHLRRAWRVR